MYTPRHTHPTTTHPVRRHSRKLIVAGATTAFILGTAAPALADGPAGNSGHSDNGSTQCQAGGQDHCPPFPASK